MCAVHTAAIPRISTSGVMNHKPTRPRSTVPVCEIDRGVDLDSITLVDFIPAFRSIGNTLSLGTYPSGPVALTSFGQ